MNEIAMQSAAARWVDDHGECLYRYALVRVRRPEVAEDLVQEALLAAVRGYEKFGGRSSERSWLVGILKNKLAKLPQKVRDVFAMREMDGVPSEEICTILSITDSNLWVMLHRARMALRECLEMNWFDMPAGGTA